MPPPQGTPNPIEGPGDYTVTKTVHSSSYPFVNPVKAPATGQSVFVVGASRGIGLAIALSFASSGASKIAIGARSNLTSVKEAILSAAAEAERSAPEVLTIELDVTFQSSVTDAAKLIEAEFNGKLDIVIINAGILSGRGKVSDSDPDEWWRTMEVNVKGPYLISRAFLPMLVKSKGAVVAVSSVGALIVNEGMSAYQGSKLGVLRLMEFAAKEYEQEGVTALAIHPGNILTDILDEGAKEQDWVKAVFVDQPQLTGDTIVWLTREKRQWLNGRYVNVTWDMEELESSQHKIVQADSLKVKIAL